MLNRYDKKTLSRCIILVSSGMISPELDALLIAKLDQLVSDIYKDESIPYDLRRLFEIFQERGADKLGLKKTLYYMLIEIACQLEYHTGPRG